MLKFLSSDLPKEQKFAHLPFYVWKHLPCVCGYKHLFHLWGFLLKSIPWSCASILLADAIASLNIFFISADSLLTSASTSELFCSETEILLLLFIFFSFPLLFPIWMAYVFPQTLIKLVLLLIFFLNFFLLWRWAVPPLLQVCSSWPVDVPEFFLQDFCHNFCWFAKELDRAGCTEHRDNVLVWLHHPEFISSFATIAIADFLLSTFCSCGVKKCPARCPIPRTLHRFSEISTSVWEMFILPNHISLFLVVHGSISQPFAQRTHCGACDLWKGNFCDKRPRLRIRSGQHGRTIKTKH